MVKSLRLQLLLIILLSSTLLQGCWDRIEIDQRGFVIGVAVDKTERTTSEEAQVEPNKPTGAHKYKVTFQIVSPGGLKQDSGGTGASGGSGEAFFNITTQEDTLASATAKFSTRTSRSPFFEHLKVIVISDEVAEAENGLADVIDYFIRDNEMRRSTKIMIAKGQARKILETKPPNEKLPVMYIESVSENNRRTARMPPETKIGDVHERLLTNTSFSAQGISNAQNDITVSGAAVFEGRKHTMVGFLNEEETEGLNLLRGEMKGGVLEFKVGEGMGVFEIERADQKMTANVTDPEHPVFHIQINAEGNLAEIFEALDVTEKSTIAEIETSIEEELIRLTRDTIDKLQKEYKKDAIGLGNFLQREHYRDWQKIKGNWDHGENLFSTCEIHVKAQVKIRRIGSINHSERREP